jgi:hypothetical protein
MVSTAGIVVVSYIVLECSRFSCNKCPFGPATVPKPNLALIETNRITVKMTSRQESGMGRQRQELQCNRRQDEEQAGKSQVAGRVTN